MDCVAMALQSTVRICALIYTQYTARGVWQVKGVFLWAQSVQFAVIIFKLHHVISSPSCCYLSPPPKKKKKKKMNNIHGKKYLFINTWRHKYQSLWKKKQAIYSCTIMMHAPSEIERGVTFDNLHQSHRLENKIINIKVSPDTPMEQMETMYLL